MKSNLLKRSIFIGVCTWLAIAFWQPAILSAGETTQFKWTESDTSFTLIGTGTVNGAPLALNDEVAALDSSGTIIGAATATQDGSWMITAYADDSGTCQDEGATPGEAIRFKIYQAETGNIYLASQTTDWTGEMGEMIIVSLEVSDPDLEVNPPPRATGHSPAPGAWALAGSTISLQLVDTSGIDVDTINMKINCQQIILNGQDQTGGFANVDASNPGDVVITYIPSVPFGCTAPVEVIINASDTDGNPMPQEFYSFSITDNQPPTVDQDRLVPAAGATNISVNSTITAFFTDSCPGVKLDTVSMMVNDVDVTSFLQNSGTPADTGISYNPVQPFSYGSTVNVKLKADDIAGAAMVQEFSYSFTTTDDNLPPVAAGLSPAQDATGVRPDVTIVLHLKDTGAGVNSGTIIMNVNGNQVTPNITGAPADYTITYTPSAPFDAGQQITVEVSAQDFVTNSISPPFEYTFTIATAGEDTTAPVASDQSPAPAATDVPASASIILKLSDNQAGVDISTITMTVSGNTVSPVITGDASSYTLTYKSPTPFTVGQALNVTLSARDLAPGGGNLLNTSYSFTVGKAPYLTNLSPTAGATQVSPTELIVFNLLDDESGVDLASLEVKINQSNAVYTSSGNENAYAIEVSHDPFGNSELVNVTISASDLAGNPMTFSYSFTAADLTAPEDVTNFNAVSGDREVSLSWTASANTEGDLAGYTIFITQNGTPLPPAEGISIGPGTTSYLARNLQNKVEYAFKIVSRDEVPNLSPGLTKFATPVATLISIAVSPAQAALDLNATLNMTATASYSDNTTEDITTQAVWSSSVPAVGTVSAQGVFTPAGQGSTNITATWGGKTSNAALITVTADVDGDGLPNDWEEANGLDPNSALDADGADGDKDGDGVSNMEEYLAGTHPNDAESLFTITTASYDVATGFITLNWKSIPGKTYDLYYSDSPYGDNMTWTLLEGAIPAEAEGLNAYLDNGSKTGQPPGHDEVTQRYYRVVVAGTSPAVYSRDWWGVFTTQLVEGMNLVSFPVFPYSALINSSIGDQMEGADLPQNADRIWFWDKINKKYDFAWLSTRSGFLGWRSTITGAPLSNLSLDPDKGFWVQIRAGHGGKKLKLVGRLALADQVINMVKGMQLFGSPYPVEVNLADANINANGASLPQDADRIWYWDRDAQKYDFAWLSTRAGFLGWRSTITGAPPATFTLKPGFGYWLQVREQYEGFNWTYPMPYSR